MSVSPQYKKKALLIALSLLALLLAEYGYSESNNAVQDEQQPNHSSRAVNTQAVNKSSAEKIQLPQNDTKEEAAIRKSLPFLFNKTSSQTNTDPAKKEAVTAMDAVSVSIGLVFILLLIFLLAWLMKKVGYSNMSGQGNLKILATLNLGQKEKISLIEVGEQQLLVGITATQINTLHVLDKPLDTNYEKTE